MNNQLLNVLDLAPTAINGVPTVNEKPTEVVEYDQTSEKQIDDDLVFVRKNLYELVETGMDSLTELTNIAKMSQHPRAFEVLNAALKTLADLNKDILEVQQKKKALKISTYEGPEVVHNHQHLTLTTTELNRMIDDAKKKMEE